MDDYDNYTYIYEEYGVVDKMNEQPRRRETMHVISIVIYSLSFVLGLVGNGMVIWVTGCKSKRTVNSVWLFNLALADLVFVLFLPFSIDYIMRDFHWQFGLVMCKFNSFVSVMTMYASVLFLMVLSLDRYVALIHLDWSRRHRRVKLAWLVCSGVWILASAMSCPVLIFRDTAAVQDKILCFMNFHEHDRHAAALRHAVLVGIRTLVGFLLPFVAVSTTGILLAIKVRRSVLQLSSFSRTVTAVILAFFLCWAPFHVFSLMELTIHSSDHLYRVLLVGQPMATSLGFFNSCVNPLLYVLLSKKVRCILKQVCFDLTKSSLRDLNQSVSASELDCLPKLDEDGTPAESAALSSL